MEQRLSFITLGVTNVAKTRKFYERLGWRASKASNKEVAFFQAGKMVFALWSYRLLAKDAGLRAGRKRAYQGFSLAHNVRSPRAVDKLLADVARAGGRVLKPGHKAFWGGYTGYFADPDGNPWEVAWNPFFPLGRDGGVKLPR